MTKKNKRTRSPVFIPKSEARTSPQDRIAALANGKELPVSLGDMMDQEVGSVPGPEVRAVLRLACAMHQAESDDCAVSWSAQERARAYINKHGLAACLDEAARLESSKR